MNEKDKPAIASLTEEPIQITILREPKGKWQVLLSKAGLLKTKYAFELKPMKVGVALRVAARTRQIPDELFIEDGQDMQHKLLKAMVSHFEDMVYIIAQGLYNREEHPPAKIYDLIRWQMDTPQMAEVLSHVMEQLSYNDFLRATVLVKGMRILPETGPQSPGGIIAPGA